MEIAEILCLAMFVVTCGFLMLGFPLPLRWRVQVFSLPLWVWLRMFLRGPYLGLYPRVSLERDDQRGVDRRSLIYFHGGNARAFQGR